MATRKESAADIVVNVGEEEVTVESLTFTKNIEITTIYGSGKTLPHGYSIDQVSYQGEFTCAGNRKDLDAKFFDANGIPKELDAISVTHFDGDATSLDTVLVTSAGYEMNNGETTETSYEFVAMGYTSPHGTDVEPTA